MASRPRFTWMLSALAGMALLAACASWPEGQGGQSGGEGGGLLNWPGPVVDSREVARSGALSWPEGPEAEAPPSMPAEPGDGSAVVQAALSVKGRPYRLGANGPRAFDCSGLVEYAYRQAGIQVPRTTTRQFREAQPVDRTNMREGDVIFFAVDGISISHVGIYGGNGRFLHSPSPGSRVSWASLEKQYWASRFAGVGRFD
ncbi:cell wall-associated NlpC family hydrolase [Natronospira proteinivora]|uniref:Cell wall-associated NlpC family hydrolase n=1 Tax=Natronospira proteinivora TaxID=1807133 RepID=A0ABT1GB80_9GAMM|nr:C40 family peptidase [Natronospira proteinivora]MCP1727162.1 cell wall-associated NlpC family hydrolase [Natronospira proteinivora]